MPGGCGRAELLSGASQWLGYVSIVVREAHVDVVVQRKDTKTECKDHAHTELHLVGVGQLGGCGAAEGAEDAASKGLRHIGPNPKERVQQRGIPEAGCLIGQAPEEQAEHHIPPEL